MVECTQGGYGGRFDRGENTKQNYENRTPAKYWSTDYSIYQSSPLPEEIEARRVRESYKKNAKPIKYSTESDQFNNNYKALIRRGLIDSCDYDFYTNLSTRRYL
jgi:hypothetical protein